MNAVLIEHQAPGGARTPLEECLPLAAPWVVQIFPVYACNFQCRYCHFSIPKADRPPVTGTAVMPLDLYTKCIDDMRDFPEKARVLRFVGMGEPLLHKDIAAMAAYAKHADVASRVELLTNGSLLAPEMSDSLIEAGLDKMVISLQGLSAAQYRAMSGVTLDFDRFVERIRYFYTHKQETHVYIKIVDVALEGEADKQRFFDLFGDICDSIGIETAAPHYPGVALNAALAGKEVTQFNTERIPVAVCPQPFFTLQINPDGQVAPCYAVPHPASMGNCATTSVRDIWRGKTWQAFRLKMLHGRETVGAACRDCGIISYRMQKEDRIMNADRRLHAVYAVEERQ